MVRVSLVNRWLALRRANVEPTVLATQWYNEMKATKFTQQSQDNRSQARKAFCNEITQRAKLLYWEIVQDPSWGEKQTEEVGTTLLLIPI